MPQARRRVTLPEGRWIGALSRTYPDAVFRVLTAFAEGQRRVLEAAIERGSYDTPRECTLTELAEQLGMAKSPVPEPLHRGEEQVIKEFVGEPTDGA